MIILKLICLFLIFFISMKIGFIMANTYKLRLNSLENIKTSLNLFKTKIEYTNDTVIQVFNQISKIIYEDKENIFKNTISNLEKDKLYENWQNCLLNEKTLKEDDKQILKIFGKNLGKLDKKRTNQPNRRNFKFT